MYIKKVYQNQAVTISEQLDLLLSQGLLIPNKEEASFYLSTVNYHRLSTYFLTFYDFSQGPEKYFRSNTYFDDVWDLYVFDRKLRVLVTDALERIEIAFRTSLINHMSIKYDPHWYVNENVFKNKVIFTEYMNKVKSICNNKHDAGIQRYYVKYLNLKFPPAWVAIESFSFGICSKLFKNIRLLEDKKEISSVFGYHPTLIDSWMNALTLTRNICAHHSRLWNRWFNNEPKDIPVYNEEMKGQKPFYQHACVIKNLLRRISPGTYWSRDLYDLISEYKRFPIWQMGFMEDWEKDPFWINHEFSKNKVALTDSLQTIS